jgi:hypothetical protein
MMIWTGNIYIFFDKIKLHRCTPLLFEGMDLIGHSIFIKKIFRTSGDYDHFGFLFSSPPGADAITGEHTPDTGRSGRETIVTLLARLP